MYYTYLRTCPTVSCMCKDLFCIYIFAPTYICFCFPGPIYEGNQIRAASGHTVVLNCTTSVSPSDHLNHVWLHNNLDVDVDSDRYTSMNNGTLIIVGVGTDDSGSYECLFSLNQTVVSNAFQLSVSTEVLFNVKFSIQPKNQTVLAGSTSVITCTATSNNQPVETRWYFNDELVSDSGIFVKEMTSISDSGEYVCFVGSKEYSNSAYLNVQGQLCVSPSNHVV